MLILIISYNIYENYKIKHAKILVELNSELTIPYKSDVKVSDFIKSINGKYDDFKIDTSSLGVKEINLSYINDDSIKVSYKFNIEVKDVTPPFVMLSDNYSVYVNSPDTLIDDILCGDDLTDEPKCIIEGYYDLNTIGSYPLSFIATDNYNNKTVKKFNLLVKQKENKKTYNNTYTDFNDVYKLHKNDKTKIGLDISKYQGNIDFNKIKSLGVSFVMIRVGTRDINNNFVLDPKFKQNIEGALSASLDVGIYFYSYASNLEEAREDARWVIKNIEGYKITLPVAFDWEDFKSFNSYKVSFNKLTNIAYAYLDELKTNGYDAMLYGSKYYLEYIWQNDKYDTWLAHYINKTTYKGKYKMWQMCSNGKIDGIDGYVDIDILYEN